MGEIINYQSYEQYKAELDGVLQKTAEDFVRVGYLLKVARDTNVLTESGYKSVAEFAQAEYGLDKTQVSRFISINDRFSEGGYSDRLLEAYQGFGYAKLTIMLQIPEEITENLSPNFTKAEIQAIKEEIDEEKKVSDLEVMMEPRKTQLEDLNLTEQVFYLLFKEDRKLYAKCWDASRRWGIDERTIRQILAPSGEKVYSVRIPGTGRILLMLDDTKDEATITFTRSNEKQTVSWKDMAEAIPKMLSDECDTAQECWEWLYMEPWPDAEVAPVQQTPQKSEPKKESKVQKAKKPEKPRTEPKEDKAAAVVEEQLPGQMSVEDYPGIVPKEEQNAEHDVPDHAGDHGDDGQPEGAEEAGNELSGSDEGDGAEEGGGSDGDDQGRENRILKVKYAWFELRDIMTGGRVDTMGKDQVKKAYQNAVDLAAAFEELIMWEEKHEK